jgi:hypothetical protein
MVTSRFGRGPNPINPTDRLSFSVPTVLSADGFQLRILLPPGEHGPAHVHVRKAGSVVVIDLPDGEQPLGIRTIRRMREADVVAAFRVVERNVDMLLEQWRKYHG